MSPKITTVSNPNIGIIKAGLIINGIQKIDLQHNQRVYFKNFQRQDFVQGKLLTATKQEETADIFIDTITGKTNLDMDLEGKTVEHFNINTLKIVDKIISNFSQTPIVNVSNNQVQINADSIQCINLQATNINEQISLTEQEVQDLMKNVKKLQDDYFKTNQMIVVINTALQTLQQNMGVLRGDVDNQQLHIQTIDKEQVVQNTRITDLENRPVFNEFKYIVGQLITLYRTETYFILGNGQTIGLLNGQIVNNCKQKFPEFWNLNNNNFFKYGDDLVLPDLVKENTYLTSGKKDGDTKDFVGNNYHTNTLNEMTPHSHGIFVKGQYQTPTETRQVMNVNFVESNQVITVQTENAGGPQPYNIQPKSFKVNYYIVLGEAQF